MEKNNQDQEQSNPDAFDDAFNEDRSEGHHDE